MAEAPLDGPNRDPWPEALWEHSAPEIDTTINLGDEGLTNGEDVGAYVDEYKANNTEIVIPEGEYTCSDRAELLTTPGGHYILRGEGGLGGVTVEQDEEASGSADVETDEDGAIAVIENIDLVGPINPSVDDIAVAAQKPDSQVIMKRFRMPDGVSDGYDDSENGIYLKSNRDGGGHQGCARFLWCQVEGFGDNGLYADGPNAADAVEGDGSPYYGQVIVVGGVYRNNNISNVRIGTPYTTVYGALIEHTGRIDTDYAENYRGLRIRQPDDSQERFDFDYDLVVSDVDINYEDPSAGVPILDSSSLVEPSTGHIENVRIYNNSDYYPILADTDVFSEDWYFTDIHIRGDSSEECEPLVTLHDSPEPCSDEADHVDTTVWWGEDEDTGDDDDGDDGGDEDDGSDDGGDDEEETVDRDEDFFYREDYQKFVIDSDTLLRYTFEATGEIIPDYEAEELSANESESPPADYSAPNGHGTWTALGHSGGGGDTYYFDGELHSFNAISIDDDVDEPEYTVYLNDEEFDESTLTPNEDESDDEDDSISDYRVVEELESGAKMMIGTQVMYLDGDSQFSTREKFVEERNKEICEE